MVGFSVAGNQARGAPILYANDRNANKMTVRQYVPEDRSMVEGWLKAHQGERAILPAWLDSPMGVIIEDEAGPVATLFLLETYRSPWAILDWPVTRPGLSRKQATESLAFAVQCLMKLAGKCVDPPAEYTAFLALPRGPLVKIMEGMGFSRLYAENCIPMVITQPD